MSIAVLGEALIDFIVCDDDAYRPHFGGSPYNVAIGLALQLHGNTRTSAGLAFAEMGSGMLVLTEGKGGALVHTAQRTIEKSAYPVAGVEDTVGAGDTFHSAFFGGASADGEFDKSVGEVSQESLADAVDFACAAAALNVSRVGCCPPTLREVSDFIESTRR